MKVALKLFAWMMGAVALAMAAVFAMAAGIGVLTMLIFWTAKAL